MKISKEVTYKSKQKKIVLRTKLLVKTTNEQIKVSKTKWFGCLMQLRVLQPGKLSLGNR